MRWTGGARRVDGPSADDELVTAQEHDLVGALVDPAGDSDIVFVAPRLPRLGLGLGLLLLRKRMRSDRRKRDRLLSRSRRSGSSIVSGRERFGLGGLKPGRGGQS